MIDHNNSFRKSIGEGKSNNQNRYPLFSVTDLNIKVYWLRRTFVKIISLWLIRVKTKEDDLMYLIDQSNFFTLHKKMSNEGHLAILTFEFDFY